MDRLYNHSLSCFTLGKLYHFMLPSTKQQSPRIPRRPHPQPAPPEFLRGSTSQQIIEVILTPGAYRFLKSNTMNNK